MREQSPGSVRWLTTACWLSFVIFAVTSTLVSVSLKRIGADLGIDLERRGALAFWRSCALVAAAVTSGLLSDRLGKRWILAAAMLAVAFGVFWTGRISTYAGLVAGLVFVGLGLGCLEALVSPLVADMHPADVARSLSVLHGFYPVGIVISALPVGWALDHGLAWQVPFAVTAVPALAVGLMFGGARYPAAPGGHASGGRSPCPTSRGPRSSGCWPWPCSSAPAARAGSSTGAPTSCRQSTTWTPWPARRPSRSTAWPWSAARFGIGGALAAGAAAAADAGADGPRHALLRPAGGAARAGGQLRAGGRWAACASPSSGPAC